MASKGENVKHSLFATIDYVIIFSYLNEILSDIFRGNLSRCRLYKINANWSEVLMKKLKITDGQRFKIHIEKQITEESFFFHEY